MSEIVFVSGGDGRLGMMAECLLEKKYGLASTSAGINAEICAPFTSKVDEEFLRTYECTSENRWQRGVNPGLLLAAKRLILISESDFYGNTTLNLPRFVDKTDPIFWEVPEQNDSYQSRSATYQTIIDCLQDTFGEEPFVPRKIAASEELPVDPERYIEVA